MKSRLSAVKYIKNNKRTCFVLIVALALTFMAMYTVAYILYSTVTSLEPITLELPKKVAYAEVSRESMGIRYEDFASVAEYGAAGDAAREKFLRDLESDPDVEKAFFSQVLNARYSGVIGGVGYEFPLIDPSEIPAFLDHIGAALVDGQMPSGEGEVLINETVMKNRGLRIGDCYEKDAYGDVFRVVGVLRSHNMACVGTPRGYYNCGWRIVVLCNENSCDFRKLAAKYGVTVSKDNGDSVSDIVDYHALYETDVKKAIADVVNVILLGVMIFLSISVLVAYVSFMRNRVNEYCLYASIGYSKSEIYGMILREMAIMFCTGILLGAVVTVGTLFLMDAVVIEPKGLVADWFMKEHLLRILGAFACIIGVLQIPVIATVYKIKTIDLIDD